MYLVTAREMQAMDRQTIDDFGIPGMVLMENAGRGAVSMLLSLAEEYQIDSVVVLAGRGNNGGDGFVVARYLIERGMDVAVILLANAKKVSGDALVNLNLLERLIQETGQGELVEAPDEEAFMALKPRILQHDLIVDAILGTGLNSDVRGFFKTVITAINQSGLPVFSIDIPSGLHADTGKPLGVAVRADATATFGFAKAGHILHPGSEFTGQLEVIDIGIPSFIAEEVAPKLALIESSDIQDLFPDREPDSHKGTYGHLLIVAGSRGKTGAAALSANAAMACGTGLVSVAVPASLNGTLEPQVLEPMTLPIDDAGQGFFPDTGLDTILEAAQGKQAVAVGPGIGTAPSTRRLVLELIRRLDLPLIIDADGLNCIADGLDILKQRTAPTVLTPHPGEMARLCGKTSREVQTSRIETAREFASDLNVTLVLKGNQTLVALPDGTVFVCPTGNPGMASGGMGDVLTGIIAGFASQGLLPEEAAAAGVYIHGLAGDILAGEHGGFGVVASRLIPALPDIIHRHLLCRSAD